MPATSSPDAGDRWSHLRADAVGPSERGQAGPAKLTGARRREKRWIQAEPHAVDHRRLCSRRAVHRAPGARFFTPTIGILAIVERHARDAAGHVMFDGKRSPEARVRTCEQRDGCDVPMPSTIPPDDCFMMGGNRGAFDDSRFGDSAARQSSVRRSSHRDSPASRAGDL